MIVRERREELGLTAQQVADRVGVSRGLISQWEGGRKIPEDRWPDLAEALEIELDDLLSAVVYVRDERGAEEWLGKVFRDHALDAHTQIVLIFMEPLSEDEDGIMTYTGSIERLAKTIRSLTTDQVREAWPKALASPYVRRYKDAEWVIRLTMPS